MTETESEQAFGTISEGMKSAGLEWVITQAAEQIRFGKPEMKSVRTTIEGSPELAVPGLDGRRRSTRETFASTREYSANERLMLLLDALERALVSTSEMEAAVRKHVFGSQRNLNLIKLIRTDEPGRQALELGRSADKDRLDSVRHLHELIANLRERI